MVANLCKCNNCDSILLDQNPQVGAIDHDLSKYPNIKHMMFINEDGGFCACPICKTDDYLMDL